MKSEFNRSVTYDEICRAIQELVEEGLVVDSGRKKWSERTGKYEMVWMLGPSGRNKSMKSIGHPPFHPTHKQTPTTTQQKGSDYVL
jgi:hypothetical protein